MTIKIGKTSYPDDVWGILNNGKLGPVFHNYVVAQRATENTAFLLALITRKGLPVLYNAFIKPGSQFEINISGAMRAPMVELGDRADWTLASWQKPLSEARNEIITVTQQNFLAKFWKSDEFREFCFKTCGSPAKVGKLIGVKDVKTLGDIMMLGVLGDKRKAETEAKKLATKEKNKFTAEQLTKALVSAGFMSA